MAKINNRDLSGCRWVDGSPGYPTPAYQDKIMSPDFIYNIVCGGTDDGSYFSDNVKMYTTTGVATWQSMPYNTGSLDWPDADSFGEAPIHKARGNVPLTGASILALVIKDETSLRAALTLLNDGYLFLVPVNGDKLNKATLTSLDAIDNTNVSSWSTKLNHASTMVGYKLYF